MNPQTPPTNPASNPFKQPPVSPTQVAQGRAVQAAHPTPQPFQFSQNYPQPAVLPNTPQFTTPMQAPTPTANPAATPLASSAAPNQPLQAIPNGPAPVVENPLSTQATLLFSELRDNLIIMKDGTFRAVVACQSINFDLMSETEREGVEYSYQNFLNSLNFTVQILVRSQKVDIGPYIERLSEMRRNNDNMLLGVLMDDYLQFISILAEEANIMDKSFFIVIPYYGSADAERAIEQTKNFFKAMSKNKGTNVTRINRDIYDKAVEELSNRVDTVISGLYQIGIQSVRLNTKALSELLYNFNNPDTAVREPLVNFSQLATTYVKKGTK